MSNLFIFNFEDMKKFVIKSLLYFVPFICLYLGYNIFIHSNLSGDIGNLGQIPFGHSYLKNFESNHPSQLLIIDTSVSEYNTTYLHKKKSIINLGDSFSRQGSFGFHNYLANILKDSIINIISDKIGTNIRTAISLINSGIIDSTNCRLLIIERVDRELIESLSALDLSSKYQSFPNIINTQKTDNNKDNELYELCQWIRLQVNYENPIGKNRLDNDYFTDNKYARELFYYKIDLNFTKLSDYDIDKATDNLKLLNELVAERGIKMIFLIAADKFDVYRPFMTDNTMPIDSTTDKLSEIPDICIINTKQMLQDMVRNGEKDVYLVNDTHWSYKGSKAVAEKIKEYIDYQNIIE
jgi:hypothetical protein